MQLQDVGRIFSLSLSQSLAWRPELATKFEMPVRFPEIRIRSAVRCLMSHLIPGEFYMYLRQCAWYTSELSLFFLPGGG